MFWKPNRFEQGRAKAAGLRAHRALFPAASSPLWGVSTPPKPGGKIKAKNLWNGVYDHPKPKGRWQDIFGAFKEYVGRLEKRGFEKLGGGAFSHVYGKPGCPTVIKVCHSGDTDPWPLFAAWAHANSSPFVPTIHSFKRHKGFYVAVIERLEKPVHETDYALGHMQAVEAFSRYVERGEPATPVEAAVMGVYPGLQPVLEAMADEFDGKAHWDMHAGNWMLRKDGSLVITDPISSNGSSDAATKVVRIKATTRRITA